MAAQARQAAATGYLLFSHGSLLCGAGCALDEHAARLRERLGAPVAIGYLNYSAPSVEEGVDILAKLGARRIVIVPYFLVPGYFVTKALPIALAPVRRRLPEMKFIVAQPIGVDDLLAEAILASTDAASPDRASWRNVYADAHSHCRDLPECPIYASTRCPAAKVSDQVAA